VNKLRNLALAGTVASLAVVASVAHAQNNRGKTFLGVKGGIYFPTNSEIRDIFGSNLVVIGISVDDFSRQADKWRLTADFDFITGKDGDDKFFAMPVTASFGRVFGSPEDNFRPYVRFGAGAAYFDYSITRPSTLERFQEKRFGLSANAEAGFFVGERLRVSAKYNWFSKVDDFDFSGLQLTATFNLVRF
jgi:hypothetical protein